MLGFRKYLWLFSILFVQVEKFSKVEKNFLTEIWVQTIMQPVAIKIYKRQTTKVFETFVVLIHSQFV